MGNRVTSSNAAASTSYTSNNLNQITQTSIGGNNTAITYDANGNTVAVGTKTFGYNDADQLTNVTIPNQKKSEFVYDSDGRKRISKEYLWDAAANGGAGGWTQSDETRFVYDGMDLVQERGADGTVKASYVRDGNIGGILSRSTPEGTFYYHYDGGGNVVALTDSNENIVAQYAYDAFGNTLSSSGAQADKNPFRFSSKYYDGDTGLYDYGYRHYDSSLGRWINRDPIGEDGGVNLYGMVGNNPVNLHDSYGLAVETPWDIINVGISAASFAANIASGNYGKAAVDGLGLLYDATATVVPVLPGGAGVAIKSARLANAAKNFSKTASLRAKFQALGTIPKGWQVHHIVPCNAKALEGAKEARDALTRLGVDVNDVMNGVALPAGFHQRMLSKEYYRHIGNMPRGWKSKRQAINELRGLALHLLKQATWIQVVSATFVI